MSYNSVHKLIDPSFSAADDQQPLLLPKVTEPVLFSSSLFRDSSVILIETYI